MKLVSCNGKELTVHDIGDVRMKLFRRTGGPPIKLHGTFIMDDDQARETIRGILATGFYERTEQVEGESDGGLG